jgi:hypothetical protein
MLNKPVLELELGQYQLQARDEYVAGNHVVRNVDETEKAILGYFAGAQIDPDRQRARRTFIEKHYYRVDGRSSERCAELIHQTITPPNYTEDDKVRRQRLTAEQHRRWKQQEDARLPNRLKDLLGIDREISLRWWKRISFEARDNLGRFVAEPEITSEMVSNLHNTYESLLGDNTAHHGIHLVKA